MTTSLFSAFAYGFCFLAGSSIVLGLAYLAPRGWEFSDDEEEARNIQHQIVKSWKPIGFFGGLLGVLYYGVAPHDPGLHAILTAVWHHLGAA